MNLCVKFKMIVSVCACYHADYAIRCRAGDLTICGNDKRSVSE